MLAGFFVFFVAPLGLVDLDREVFLPAAAFFGLGSSGGEASSAGCCSDVVSAVASVFSDSDSFGAGGSSVGCCSGAAWAVSGSSATGGGRMLFFLLRGVSHLNQSIHYNL